MTSTGLYRAGWDEVEFLVVGYPKARYKRVKTTAQGMTFIRDYFRAKGVTLPKWLRGGRKHYPQLSQIRSHLGLDITLSEFSDEGLSEDESGDSKATGHGMVEEGRKIGVDESIGKESELFGVYTKR